jgi:A/G-specific adenine glycosylase
MLHRAAKVVATEMNGIMPCSSVELRKLPGVGRYTAAAIASIAFGEPAAVVDGNVERVLARFFGRELSPEENWETAQIWLCKRFAGDWNQAMMELGATVCTPVNPQCKQCPLRSWCQGRVAVQNGEKPLSESLPARKRKVVARALGQRAGRVYLVQRPVDAKKMAGMWELPEAELNENADALMKVRHSITDTDYLVHIYAQSVKGIREGRWCGPEELDTLALTGLTRKVLRKLGILAR